METVPLLILIVGLATVVIGFAYALRLRRRIGPPATRREISIIGIVCGLGSGLIAAASIGIFYY